MHKVFSILSSVLVITKALIIVWTSCRYSNSALLIVHPISDTITSSVSLLSPIEMTCFPSWDASRQCGSVWFLSQVLTMAELFPRVTWGNSIFHSLLEGTSINIYKQQDCVSQVLSSILYTVGLKTFETVMECSTQHTIGEHFFRWYSTLSLPQIIFPGSQAATLSPFHLFC